MIAPSIHRIHLRSLGLALAILSGPLLGCSHPEPSRQVTPLALPPADSALLNRWVGYPPGPWWLSNEQLVDVRLAARHILISHAQAAPRAALLGIVHRAADRTKLEALRLAVALAHELQQRPAEFDRLAREYSNDRATAALGGALGTFAPFAVPRTIVDALGQLSPGGVSRVVETELGYHVLQRLATPQETRISGSRILIGDRDSNVHLARPEARQRSREAALDRALRIAAELQRDPTRFDAIARAESDAADAARGGDLGSWSSFESAPSALIETLRQLPVGASSHAIETEAGFEILRHDAERPRRRYGLRELLIAHQSAATPLATATLDQSAARELAEAMLRALVAGRSFDDVAGSMCVDASCQSATYAETEGRGNPTAELELLRVAPGQLVPRIFEGPFGYSLVARAADPLEQEPSPQYRTELPGPLSVEQAIARLSPAQLSANVRVMGRAALSVLEARDHAAVLALFEQLANEFEAAPPAERERHLRETRARLRELVGDERAAAVAALVSARLNEVTFQ